MSEKGIGLIELMVASSLALLLLAIVTRFYQQYQQTHRYQKSLATIQENGRTAIDILQYALKAAGYTGCARLEDPSELEITQYRNGQTTSSKPIPREYVRHFLSNTDAIVIRHMQTQNVDLTVSATARQKQIKVSDQSSFKEGDRIIISDCVHAQMNAVKETKTGQLYLKTPLLQDVLKSAEVGRLVEYVCYIADTGRKNTQGKPVYALYQLDLGRTRLPSEIVEGINSMKIVYDKNTIKITLGINSVEAPILQREWHTYVNLRNIP